MAPKRGQTFGGNRGNQKRKKFNLISIRQKGDYRKYGEAHPAEDEGRPTKYTKVKDTVEKKSQNNDASSSSSDEEEAPVLQQLLQEIGVKEDEPESEQEDDEDDSEDEEEDDDEEEVDEEEEEIDEDEEELDEDEEVNENEELDEDEEDVDELDEDEEDEDELDEEEEEGDEEGRDVYDEIDSDDGIKKVNGKYFFDADGESGEDEEEDDDDGFFVDGSEDSDEEEENNNETVEMEMSKLKGRVILDSSSEEEVDIEANGNALVRKNKEKKLKKSGQDTQKAKKGKEKKKKENKKKKRMILDVSEDENENVLDKDDEDVLKGSDPFSIHFETEVDAEEFLEKNKVWTKQEMKVPGLGKSMFMYKDVDFLRDIKASRDLKSVHVKHKLCDRLAATNTKYADVKLKEGETLSNFQHKMFNVLNTYQDLLYPKQTAGNTEEIRLVYCLHAVNHVLKTRSRIMAHNAKMKSRRGKSADDDVEYRDQGLTRPKVVILLPYREKAKKVVNMIISLLSASQRLKAGSLNRFMEEFSEIETREISTRKYKAEDYLKMFEGNIDDNFRVGLSISKMNVKLYCPLYAADIILASPLGLRTLIGDPGDPERDFDFLSSIEMLIMDQSDVFMMQNWDHVLHSIRHFHLQPKEAHDVDFSRVRMWAIEGLSKYFRQTIIFSNVLLPELISVFNKYCHNYCGKIMMEKIEKVGTVRSCLSDVPQIFHRVPCSKPDGVTQTNAKLAYFKKKILPLHTSAGMNRTIIYCNYFTFVKLRNLLREEGIFFLFIHEYDREKDIKKNRIKFRKLNPPFLFYTERLHFHYRFRLRGAYHLVWFDVPQYPIFYPELVNLMDVNKQACTSTCLFTKYEGQKLMEIVGQKNASHMLNSEKSVNMITVS